MIKRYISSYDYYYYTHTDVCEMFFNYTTLYLLPVCKGLRIRISNNTLIKNPPLTYTEIRNHQSSLK